MKIHEMKIHEINNGLDWAIRAGHTVLAEQDRDDHGRFSGPGGGGGGAGKTGREKPAKGDRVTAVGHQHADPAHGVKEVPHGTPGTIVHVPKDRAGKAGYVRVKFDNGAEHYTSGWEHSSGKKDK